MKLQKLSPILAVLAAITIAACSTDSVTAPQLPVGGVVLGATPAEKAYQDSVKEEREARRKKMEATRDSVKKSQKATRERDKDAYEALRRDWKAYKKQWAEYKKENKEARVELLRCQPLEYAADAEIIGPSGGELKVGPHKLVIPRGALAEEMLLVAEAPMGSLVQVRFGPHGLQFDASSSLTLSYAHCMRPDSFTYRIVYTNDSGSQVYEFPPSEDNKALKAVTAPIDHFSSYIIAF